MSRLGMLYALTEDETEELRNFPNRSGMTIC